MARGKATKTIDKGPLILGSEISPHCDIIIGRSAPLDLRRKKKGKTILEQMVRKWIKDFAEGRTSERRKMIPVIAQDLLTEGCRFLESAYVLSPTGELQYYRTDDTRQIHTKIRNIMSKEVKIYEEWKAKHPPKTSPPPPKTPPPVVTQPLMLPVAPPEAAAVSPSTDATPVAERPPKAMFYPILPREKTTAPFLTRNSSMLSILSGTHSVDGLIGSLVGDGVFGDIPKSFESQQQLSRQESKCFSVEEQADTYALGMLHPQESMGQQTSSSFEEWTRDMQMSPPLCKLVRNHSLMMPPTPALNSSTSYQSVISMLSQGKQFDGSVVAQISPTLSMNLTPASDSVNELTSSNYLNVRHRAPARTSMGGMSQSCSTRLARLEQAVAALLRDNVDLRRLLNERPAPQAPVAATNHPPAVKNYVAAGVEETASVASQVDWMSND